MIAYQVLLSLASASNNARSMKYTTMVLVKIVRPQLMIFLTTIGHRSKNLSILMTLLLTVMTSMITLEQLKIVSTRPYILQLVLMLCSVNLLNLILMKQRSFKMGVNRMKVHLQMKMKIYLMKIPTTRRMMMSWITTKPIKTQTMHLVNLKTY